MKTYTPLYTLFFLWISNFVVAQTTAIPDPYFEQALIDLNIDSDGIVNGQVLTADIENITVLDFEELPYEEIFNDISGIEDFTALEVLDFANNGVYLYNPPNPQVFSNNLNLKELTMKNQCGDCGGVYSPILDLSGLPNLEYVNLRHVQINKLILNNPDFDLLNLTLDLYHEGFPGGDWTNHICIEVADPAAATNNQYPYNTWDISIDEFTTTYGFDDNCNLDIQDVKHLNTISLYPNPTTDRLYLTNPNQIPINKVEVYSITGQLVQDFTAINEYLDVSNLKAGVYFVKIVGETSTNTFKIIKN